MNTVRFLQAQVAAVQSVQGPKGDQGDPGPQGIQGPPGPGSSSSYTPSQSILTEIWDAPVPATLTELVERLSLAVYQLRNSNPIPIVTDGTVQPTNATDLDGYPSAQGNELLNVIHSSYNSTAWIPNVFGVSTFRLSFLFSSFVGLLKIRVIGQLDPSSGTVIDGMRVQDSYSNTWLQQWSFNGWIPYRDTSDHYYDFTFNSPTGFDGQVLVDMYKYNSPNPPTVEECSSTERRINKFVRSLQYKMEMWSTLDKETQAGIVGQLAGHGIVIGKQVLGGTPISQAVNGTVAFWALFQMASEYLTGYASKTLGTPIAGVVVPAGVQYAALTMYEPGSKRAAQDLMRGSVKAILDSPFLAGSVGSIIAKSYA